ncbi:MAG: hypothetical protein JWM36_4684 [Hyphomicrobiales bacterium]|nr:hypothetical protein [Hyphomicrobiales bacterium]
MTHSVIAHVSAAARIVGAKLLHAVGDLVVRDRSRAAFVIGRLLRVCDGSPNYGSRRESGDSSSDGSAVIIPTIPTVSPVPAILHVRYRRLGLCEPADIVIDTHGLRRGGFDAGHSESRECEPTHENLTHFTSRSRVINCKGRVLSKSADFPGKIIINV